MREKILHTIFLKKYSSHTCYSNQHETVFSVEWLSEKILNLKKRKIRKKLFAKKFGIRILTFLKKVLLVKLEKK